MRGSGDGGDNVNEKANEFGNFGIGLSEEVGKPENLTNI